jgi:hypothetical protein
MASRCTPHFTVPVGLLEDARNCCRLRRRLMKPDDRPSFRNKRGNRQSAKLRTSVVRRTSFHRSSGTHVGTCAWGGSWCPSRCRYTAALFSSPARTDRHCVGMSHPWQHAEARLQRRTNHSRRAPDLFSAVALSEINSWLRSTVTFPMRGTRQRRDTRSECRPRRRCRRRHHSVRPLLAGFRPGPSSALTCPTAANNRRWMPAVSETMLWTR